ncbi:MAG: LPS export ABC transporter periplasmic protein LptC [Flavobacteriales bacterium]
MIKPYQKFGLFIPIIAVIGMFFSGCENDLSEVNRLTYYEKLPVQTIKNSFITYTDSAVTQFTVEAGQIDRYPSEEDPIDEFSNGVHLITFDKKGEFESEIIAENATNHLSTKIMIARDSVVLRNAEGKMLETELLTWDDNTGKIFTDKFVKITTPTEILYGDGLTAEQDFSSYEILNIKGRIKVDSE